MPLSWTRYIGSIEEDQQRDAKRYRLLRDYLLLNSFVRHRALSANNSDPPVIGINFYGESFGAAVDTLKASSGGIKIVETPGWQVPA